MDFTYNIKGITLDMTDMYEIKEFYEIRCTAEYIADNYKVSDEEAISYATEVRRLMNRYGASEEEAIAEVVKV